jgi:hypothetical protein
MNARESENYLAISRSSSASKSVEICYILTRIFVSTRKLTFEISQGTTVRLNETRFGPKKSRPRYISAQHISTLFDALDEREIAR